MILEGETRTRQQIYARIQEIKIAWQELVEETPDSASVMHDELHGQLTALYWVLGHSIQSAIDNAQVVLGGDPVDWS